MRDATQKLHFFLNDHLGSTRVVIDSTGMVKDKYWYYAFSEPRNEQVSTNQSYRYTSKPLDKEGGLNIYYYGARYYDSELNRFWSIDPAAGKYPGWSPYAYCADNPLRNIDPDGNVIETATDVVSVGMSAYDLYKEPSWKNAGYLALDVVSALVPVVPAVGVVRHADKIKALFKGADKAEDAAKAAVIGQREFKSFGAFKRAMGPAGEGMEWHHVVEQSKVGQFGDEAIHNTENIVKLPQEVNQAVNALYSSKRSFSEGKTVREWLQGQSWEKQKEFGQKAIEDAMKAFEK